MHKEDAELRLWVRLMREEGGVKVFVVGIWNT